MWTTLLLPVLLTAASPAKPCGAPEFRQFDFWLGQWEVTTAKGKAGRNRIEALHGGCALAEHWESASGTSGTSLNVWDAPHKVWRQFWVDAGGGVLRLEGGLQGKSMVLSGTQVDASGNEQLQRITWTPLDNRSVRQHWEQSSDGGKTWISAFDGHYRRVAESP